MTSTPLKPSDPQKQTPAQAQPQAQAQAQMRPPVMSGSRESFPPNIQAREMIAHVCQISSQSVLSYREVSQFMGSLNWASGLISLGRLYMRPLQQYFYSLGLTDRFAPPCQSETLVLATLSGSGRTYRCSYQESRSGLSRRISRFPRTPRGGFPDFGCLDPFRSQAPHQCAGAQGRNIGPLTLGVSITGQSSYDRYRQ